MTAPAEEWRWVVGSDTHEVSNLGRGRCWLKRRTHERLAAPRLILWRSPGYKYVHLVVDGEPRTMALHRMVLEAFVGPCQPGMVGCHFPNRNTDDNALRNLRWDSSRENARDASAHNLGVAETLARLTELQRDFPWLRATEGMTVRHGWVEPLYALRSA